MTLLEPVVEPQLRVERRPEPPGEVPFHVTSVTEQDIAAVVSVMRDGWLTTGQRCVDFEHDFTEHLGGRVTSLAVSSCTAALHLALEAVGVRPGDRVITSAYTFTAVGEVIRHLGAHPVLADVDPVTGNVTARTVTDAWRRLTPSARRRVRAVVPVHYAGLACEMEVLTALAAQHRWAVVDDAAHALPATRAGRSIGTWGDATAFSFYATKTLSTGEGGMLTTSRPEVAARARTMRLHGIDRDCFDRYRRKDAWRYEVVDAGYKYNLTDMAAALGVSQLGRLHAMRDRRAAVADRYDEAFAGVDGLALPAHAPDGDVHARHLYPLRVLGGVSVRDVFIRELAALGVSASVHFIPLHHHPHYQDTYGVVPDDLPGATTLFQQEVSLPLFPGMTPGQVEQVVEAVPVALARAERQG
ncbi:MAG: DegT/DnrJ/EryC1/StrS aminotransferase [Frankiales bacterium]|nr:DegT/DnrJ/EryC1/StrS aminotransferase [Frankiales bacterium]